MMSLTYPFSNKHLLQAVCLTLLILNGYLLYQLNEANNRQLSGSNLELLNLGDDSDSYPDEFANSLFVIVPEQGCHSCKVEVSNHLENKAKRYPEQINTYVVGDTSEYIDALFADVGYELIDKDKNPQILGYDLNDLGNPLLILTEEYGIYDIHQTSPVSPVETDAFFETADSLIVLNKE